MPASAGLLALRQQLMLLEMAMLSRPKTSFYRISHFHDMLMTNHFTNFVRTSLMLLLPCWVHIFVTLMRLKPCVLHVAQHLVMPAANV